ncbi:MAG: 4-alpha-glucanotransferase, partial [Anaerovorax sp.]
WSHPDLFCLDERGNPSVVAGCPPDYFSQDGQLWGNPIYHWSVHKKDGYQWWLNRIKKNLVLFDVLRIDHFRGFDSYYTIPFQEATAKNGRWETGPGMDFIGKLKEELKPDQIIAEDLGLMTPGVKQLLKDSGFPGMSVLQFAFDAKEASDYLPHKHRYNSVVYTGTHDNTTAMDFFQEMSEEDEAYAKAYLRLTEEEGFNWGLIRGAFASVANLAIIPMQDYLGLGKSARMNVPSTLGGNWTWRMSSQVLTDPLAKRIYQVTQLYERI